LKSYKPNYELLLGSLLIFIFIFTIYNKINLTTYAQQDVSIISQLYAKNKIQFTPSQGILKNQFNGNIDLLPSINSNQKGFVITSTKLPYQSCLQYGLQTDFSDILIINNHIARRLGDLPNRDKILDLCLLDKKKSIIQFISLK
jgi:hypothetical protein